MKIPVFLSYPKPHLKAQQAFISRLEAYLGGRGLEPRTLGVTDYDMDAPLKAIRRLMLESDGLITVALRRTLIASGTVRPSPDITPEKAAPLSDVWLTSPYCQIEVAMGYQVGLPTLILREEGVHTEGLLEKGAVGVYMPEFSLAPTAPDFLQTPEWSALVGKWEGLVRSVVDAKGNPPRLY